MSDDDLAKQVGEAMNAQDTDVDARLERRVRDELTAEELRELEEEAARDPSTAEALELCAPLSDDLRKRLVTDALRSRRGPRPRLVPLAGGATALILAAAAAFALVARSPAPSLPSYTVVVDASEETWRGGAGDELSGTLREDTEMTVVLRPARSVEERLEARLWVETGEGPHRISVAPDISADGAARWKAPAGILSGGRRGKVRFLAVVGRASSLPAPDEVAPGHPSPDWEAFRFEVEILPAP